MGWKGVDLSDEASLGEGGQSVFVEEARESLSKLPPEKVFLGRIDNFSSKNGFRERKKQAPLVSQGRSGWLHRANTYGPEVLTEDCQDNRRLVTLLTYIPQFGMFVKWL